MFCRAAGSDDKDLGNGFPRVTSKVFVEEVSGSDFTVPSSSYRRIMRSIGFTVVWYELSCPKAEFGILELNALIGAASDYNCVSLDGIELVCYD